MVSDTMATGVCMCSSMKRSEASCKCVILPQCYAVCERSRFVHEDAGQDVLPARKVEHVLEGTVRQMNDIGVGSLSIVLMASLFIGAVTAVQSAYQLYGTPFVPPYYLGLIVRNTTILELAPHLPV